MAAEGEEVELVDTRLTKNRALHPKVKANEEKDTDDVSCLTVETRESKAKAYAAVESKKIASQYITTISDIKYSNQQVFSDLQAKVDAALNQIAKKSTPTVNDNFGIDDINKNKDNNIIIINDSDNIEKDCMSGLSLSSEKDSWDEESNSEMDDNDDNKLLIVGVHKTREKIQEINHKKQSSSISFLEEKGQQKYIQKYICKCKPKQK